MAQNNLSSTNDTEEPNGIIANENSRQGVNIAVQVQSALEVTVSLAQSLKRHEKTLDKMNGLVYFGFIVIIIMVAAMVIAYVQQINNTSESLNRAVDEMNELKSEIKMTKTREQEGTQGSLETDTNLQE